MDIECLLTAGCSCLRLSFYTGLIEFFICFCIKCCEICWFPHYMSDYNGIAQQFILILYTVVFRSQVKSHYTYHDYFDSAPSNTPSK